MSAAEINEKPEKKVVIPPRLPLLPVRDVVVFPFMVVPLAVGREKSIKALEIAMATDRLVFISAQKKANIEDPQEEDLFKVGTVSEVLQMLKMADGTLKILVEGIQRGSITGTKFITERGYIEASVEVIKQEQESTSEIEAQKREALELFDQYVKLNRRLVIDISTAVRSIEDASKLCDTITSHLMIKQTERQGILETFALDKRLEMLNGILNREIEILNIERKI